MAIKSRINFRKFYKVLASLGVRLSIGTRGHIEAAGRSNTVHSLIILIIILLVACFELVIQQILDNDKVMDMLAAMTTSLGILLFHSALANARLHRELSESSEELERRITEIAHEFQTPITILKGNISVLASTADHTERSFVPKPSKAERAAAASIIMATLDRLSRLVRNLLDISKLDTTPHKMARKIVDLAALAEMACEDCAVMAEDKGVRLICLKAPDAASSGIFAVADEDRLHEVLLNLLGNALRHTPRGGAITISVERALLGGQRHDATSAPAEIVVADTGSGIPPEDLPHIFERFYRIRNLRNDTGNGTGLGLHICQKIIEAHGGTITAESEPGNGSHFIIRLPTVPSPQNNPRIVVL